MKLGKHAVKVLAVFAVLFVVGFALKFLNLHEGFVTIGTDNNVVTFDANNYRNNNNDLYKEKQAFMKDVRNAAKEREIKGRKKRNLLNKARNEATEAKLTIRKPK